MDGDNNTALFPRSATISDGRTCLLRRVLCCIVDPYVVKCDLFPPEEGRERREHLRRMEEQRRAFQRAEEDRVRKRAEELQRQQEMEKQKLQRVEEESARKLAEDLRREEIFQRELREREQRDEEERVQRLAEDTKREERNRKELQEQTLQEDRRVKTAENGRKDKRVWQDLQHRRDEPESLSSAESIQEVFNSSKFRVTKAAPASGSNMRAWALASASDSEDSGKEDISMQKRSGPPSIFAMLPSMKGVDSDSGSDDEPIFVRR